MGRNQGTFLMAVKPQNVCAIHLHWLIVSISLHIWQRTNMTATNSRYIHCLINLDYISVITAASKYYFVVYKDLAKQLLLPK